jgi:hypothetical protein
VTPTTVTTYPQKITLREMRASGVRDVLVYCRDHHCSHHIEISADRWDDHIRLSDIEPGFVCTACGKRGADVRPNFSGARMGPMDTRRSSMPIWQAKEDGRVDSDLAEF